MQTNETLADCCSISGLSALQLNQLRELNWLEQCYNIMFSGPSGTGKTYISAGLCYDALRRGYKAYFRGISDILATLRLKELTPTAIRSLKDLLKLSLLLLVML